MAKTPPYLKGLAETRARAAGEASRHEELIAQFNAKLTKAKNVMDACDILIRKALPRSNPSHTRTTQELRRRRAPLWQKTFKR